MRTYVYHAECIKGTRERFTLLGWYDSDLPEHQAYDLFMPLFRFGWHKENLFIRKERI